MFNRTVGGEKIEKNWPKNGPLRDTGLDDLPRRTGALPDCLSLPATKIGSSPVDEIRMQISRADVADKIVMTDAVERLANVDGDGGCTHGRLLLVEARRDTMGEWEESGDN